MNSSRAVRLILALVCLATVFVSLFGPLITAGGFGIKQSVNIAFLLGAAGTLNGSLGVFVNFIYFLFAVLWVVTAILALIFPASKKAPGIMGVISGAITFIASTIVLILLLATDAGGSLIGGYGGVTSVGFGAIAVPILCLLIIVLSIVVLAIPDNRRKKQNDEADRGADAVRFNEVPAPGCMPAQNYAQMPGGGPVTGYMPSPGYPQPALYPPAQSAHIIGVNGVYSGARLDVSDGKPIMFGRDTSTCSVIFDSTAPAISRQHCIVTYIPGIDMYSVRDMSKNGTFAGSMSNRLPAHVDQTLPRGTVLYLGTSANAFRLDR